MKVKIVVVAFLLFFANNLFAQDLNAYKYVTVPKKFDFQKTADKYQLNSLTKFLFDKKGITTLLNDEKQPDDLYNNPCLGLKTNVVENSNMFTTKLAIQLIDCRNNVVYTSEEGRSKLKDLKKGHHDALRKAFQSIQALDYAFDESLAQENPVATKETPKVAVEETPVVVQENTAKAEEKVTTEVKEATQEEVKDMPFALIEDSSKNILYAQKITNGFQLVDSTPKIVFKALKSLNDDNRYYLENKAGILYKKDDVWYAEYYKAVL